MTGDSAEPRPAATVVLLRPGPRGPEVLLTHRPSTMDFGPGLHVFPGGAIDQADQDRHLWARSTLAAEACAAAWAGDLAPDAAMAAALGAIRELFEETGVLLASGPDGRSPDPMVLAEARRADELFGHLIARLDLRLRTDRLIPLSRWVTPPVGLSRRYDTRFFVAELAPGSAIVHDELEIVDHTWMTPFEALAARAGGRIELWPPTRTTLEQLAAARDAEDVARHLRPLTAAVPPRSDVLGPAILRVRVHGAGGIPGAVVNAHVVGRRRAVVVDPGDPNDAAIDAILASVERRGTRIAGVVLTAPVPDHAAGSTSVARRFGVPVLAAGDAAREASTATRSAAPTGAGGAGSPIAIDTRSLDDGELLDLADEPIRVLRTPGTHPDHVALDLPRAGVVLVGDLDGDGPSRAVPEPVDRVALRRSREALARLGPRLWLPAHGEPREHPPARPDGRAAAEPGGWAGGPPEPGG